MEELQQSWPYLPTMAAQHLALDGDQTSPLARLRPNGQPLRKRAIVNGGGIGGLTAARALLDAGCDVWREQRAAP